MLPFVSVLLLAAPAAHATASKIIVTEAATGNASTTELRGIVSQQSAEMEVALVVTIGDAAVVKKLQRADYSTSLGPVSRPLRRGIPGSPDCEARPCGRSDVAVMVDTSPEQLQEFVEEGEPWRLTLDGDATPSIPVIVPPAAIIEFLDHLASYQETHPTTDRAAETSHAARLSR